MGEAGERQTGRRQTGGAEKGWDLGMKGNGFWGFAIRRVEESKRERRQAWQGEGVIMT